jgi:thioredoxin-like negative regulator of GroEL
VTTLLCATVLQTALLISGAETTPATAKAAPAAKAASAAAKTTSAAKAKPAAKTKTAKKAKAAPEKAKPTPETYTAAREDTAKTGKPMVIMVSTDWCPPCQVMKRSVLPRVRAHGLLRKVAFARVNPDQEAELANQITGGGPIPQLVMFRKTKRGWVRKALVGGQSVETVEEFINEALASDKDEKKAEKKTNVVDKSSKRG